MASSSINLDTVLPPEYALPEPVSSSASILRKTQVRILPSAQVDYSPDSSSWIEFNINSPTEQLLLPESYFIFEFGRTGSADYDYSASFDKAGIHGCIKTIQVRVAGANSQIHYVQNYHRMISNVIQLSENADRMDSVNQLEGMGRCDTRGLPMCPKKFSYGSKNSAVIYDNVDDRLYFTTGDNATSGSEQVNAGGIVYNASTNYDINDVVLYTDNAIYEATVEPGAGEDPSAGGNWVKLGDVVSPLSLFDICEGDTLSLQNATFRYILTVVGIDTDYLSLSAPNSSPAYATFGSKTGEIYLLDVHERSARQKCLDLFSSDAVVLGNRQRIIFKPRTSFFAKNLPLYAIKGGITIRFELEKANLCMKSGLSPFASTSAMNYKIKNPRFVAMMSAPEPSVMRDTISRWNSPGGLIYHCPSVLYREAQTTMATEGVVLNFHAGVRSARSLLLLMQSDDASQNISSQLARAVDSLSSCLKTNTKTWQVQVGAHLFPMEKVDIEEWRTDGDGYDREAMQYLHSAFMNREQWIPYSEFEEKSYDYSHPSDTVKKFKEAKSFMIYVDLSRSNSSNSALTGTDLSLVPLQFNLGRSSSQTASSAADDGNYPGSNIIYRMFIFYDSFIRIGSNVITTLQ